MDEAFINLYKTGVAITEYGNLSVEEVKEYIANGLDFDDIRAADIMSRKGVKSTETILLEKRNGSSWFDIAKDIHNIDLYEDEEFNFDTIESPYEIIESVKLAKRTNRPVKEILCDVVNGESSIKKNFDFKTEKM